MRNRVTTRRPCPPMQMVHPRARCIAGARAVLALGTLACLGTFAPIMASPIAESPPSAGAGDARVHHTRFRIDAGDGIREIEIEGKVRFSEDESRIEWLGDGAHVRIVTEEGGRRTRFEVTADGQGRPVARIAVDGRARSFDADAQRRLADTLPVVFRELGHNAEMRVRRTLEQGGSAAVLRLIAGIRSEYSTRLHYDAYLDLENLTDAEISSALSRLGEDLDSDTELAAVLNAAADLYQERPGVRSSYLACLAAFDSVTEKARFTQNLFGVETIGAGDQPVLSRAPGDC